MIDVQLICPGTHEDNYIALWSVWLQTLSGLSGCRWPAVVIPCQIDTGGDKQLQDKISQVLRNSVLRFFDYSEGRFQAPPLFHSSWLCQEPLHLGLDDDE